jgi:hypothetical protein
MGAQGDESPLRFLIFLIQAEIICDNIPNFGQFVKIWHYFTFKGQTSTCNFFYIQNGILTNKPCSDCTLSSYDKTMKCWKLFF